MKHLLTILIFLSLMSVASASETAWKIKGKYINPVCLIDNDIYFWMSGDNYEEYYNRYLGKDYDYEDDDFQSFIINIGLYLNKEIPLNDKFPPSWNGDWNNNEDSLSLSMDLDNCLINDPVTYINQEGYTLSYIILENLSLIDAKKLAPNINQKFLSIKTIKTTGTHSYTATLGALEINDSLIMIPLKN